MIQIVSDVRRIEMENQEDAKKYLSDVDSWLNEISYFLIDLNNDSKEDIHQLINETKGLVREERERQEIEESGLITIQYSVQDINDYIQTRVNELERQQGAVTIGKHKLPPLPYAYDALEPYISKEIMILHHDKHHQSYVEGLNKAEKMMKEARDRNNYDLIKHWEREAAFHGSGHYLHTIFWDVMNPKGGGQPHGELLKQIQKDFGSFDKFKRHFSEAAKKVEGVGWAILVWSPRAHHLEILQSERHQLLTQWDTIPLLVLDVWEHAYYLQYKNDRNKYVDNWWNIVYWSNVEKRFNKAKELKWDPY
ncbi:superoxide dismutase [Heyndrickxia sp. NPDC080065]|uniref:superoxide dismutase n=1 Tax=Heyndrickxia sp. NPDC080065 TaxID=3390568 RepID=UPI003D0187F1